nr:hypothetical protein [uncultured Ottowia sp.]
MKRRKTDAPLERFKKDSCLRPFHGISRGFHGGFHGDFTGDHAALRAIDGAAQSLGRMGVALQASARFKAIRSGSCALEKNKPHPDLIKGDES